MSRARDIADSASTINALDNVTASGAELNILDGVTSTTAELNILDGVTSTATEINKLDALSRGSLIYGNASAETAILTKGSADQVLTSDGTDIAWAAAAGGSFTLLNTYNTTSGTTVDVEDFSTTYDSYMIVLSGVYTALTGRNLGLRLKVDGSYVASQYSFFLMRGSSSGVSYNQSSSATYIEFCTESGNVTGNDPNGKPYDGVIWIHDVNTSKKSHGVHFTGSAVTSSNSTNFSGNGYLYSSSSVSAAPVRGIRFFQPDISQSFSGGAIRIYGLAKSQVVIMARQHLTANGLVDFTAEEEAEWDAQEAEWAAGADDRMAAEHRSTRNNLLAETDWMANSDVTMADNWKTYRQALRDLPTHSNWPNLEDSDWPTKP